MLGYGFLCLLAGMAVVAFKMFPYGFVRDAWLGAQAALYFVEPEDRTGWRRSHEAGVHRYDPARAHDGVTLYTSSHAQKAFLIDMQGKVLHEWYLPRNAASNASSEGSDPAEDIKFYWADVELYSNGDLLVIYHAADQTPYGYGLAKIDKDSKLIWADLTHAHHDVSIGEDGLIYTLTQRIRQDPVPALPALTSPMLEDFVLVLSPSGERLKEISIYETLAKSRFGSVLDDFRPGSKGDHFHANDVDPVGSETAAALPFAREGQVLVSLRNLSALALIDLDSEEVVW